LKRLISSVALIVVFFCVPCICPAGTVFTGSFSSDGDVATFILNATSGGAFSALSRGYGGWTPSLIVPGGFATSLALYDNSGNQFAHDYLGGTAVGASCSNGAQQDPVTGFCEDATLSFFLPAGLYTLTLSVQGNDGPDPLSNGFPLAPGDNFPGGPFQDPGAPGSVIRTGNWALDVTLTGDVTQTPEPSTAIFALTGAAAALWVRRRRRTRLQEFDR
jgi:MYXO-CTERM domain-containing protein